mmetsp:Transcript_11966/g.29267  ORF Transcript_11966/g.29267 Transcript_11966/m.29267 type:complete len:201 (-) Transcript_11966:977-1579(-)
MRLNAGQLPVPRPRLFDLQWPPPPPRPLPYGRLPDPVVAPPDDPAMMAFPSVFEALRAPAINTLVRDRTGASKNCFSIDCFVGRCRFRPASDVMACELPSGGDDDRVMAPFVVSRSSSTAASPCHRSTVSYGLLDNAAAIEFFLEPKRLRLLPEDDDEAPTSSPSTATATAPSSSSTKSASKSPSRFVTLRPPRAMPYLA